MLGIDPLSNYNFFVSIDGIAVAQFRECDGLSISIKVIEHRAQSIDGKPELKKLPGVVSYEDIVLKRGKINDEAFWRWIHTVQKGDIDGARKTGTIMLFDYNKGIGSQFGFKAGWPSMVEVGKLQAGGGEVLLETVKITHEGLTIAGVTE